jgi:hypothetical protein
LIRQDNFQQISSKPRKPIYWHQIHGSMAVRHRGDHAFAIRLQEFPQAAELVGRTAECAKEAVNQALQHDALNR